MYNVMSLDNLITALGEEDTKEKLLTFEGKSDVPNDIESFLHEKAIQFEKSAIASTYLVFEEETNILVGFFSLANKPLTMSEKNFDSLSNTQRNRLKQYGRKIGNKFQINSYLIGQLGKNFSKEAEKKISGADLLTLAFDKVAEASAIIRAKYVWLECDNNEKLINFYSSFGFKQVNPKPLEDELVVLILKIK
ncbi:GNAT family N-acetyltransferase [Streptococcus sp.]|uniref:GNAT family N-acetyltransferase n=1 Tax=Streptococcus sp. TaxID=1306 RepID=UPI0021B5FC41|nr:GNAT family N-acetyltransferase [Streptococcus sp.]